MIELTVDEQTRTSLHNLDQALELRDVDGRVLGHFIPLPERRPRMAEKWEYEGVDSPTSREELLRRAEEGGGRTWPEIRADLERSA
jgi:hypothetical protein